MPHFLLGLMLTSLPAWAQASRHTAGHSQQLPWQTLLLVALLLALAIVLGLLLRARCQVKQLKRISLQSGDQLRAFEIGLQQSPISVVIADTSGKILYVNPFMCQQSGYSEQELLRMHTRELKSGLTPAKVYHDMWRHLKQKQPWSGRISSRNKQGEEYLEQVWMAPVLDENNAVYQYVAIKQDISEQERSLIRIKAHNRVLNQLSQGHPIKSVLEIIGRSLEQENPHWKAVFLCVNTRGDGLQWTAAHDSLSGLLELPEILLSDETMLGVTPGCHSFITPLDSPSAIFQRAQQAGMQSCWLEPVVNTAGHPLGLILLFHRAQQAPTRQEQNLFAHIARLTRNSLERHQQRGFQRLAEAVYSNSNEGMAVTDNQGRFVHVNPAFTRITGYQASEVHGQLASSFTSIQHPPATLQRMNNRLRQQGSWQGEIWSQRKNGEQYPLYLSINTTNDADGQLEYRVILFTDISKQKANEEEVWRMANFDSLTKLANRRNFMEKLHHALNNARRYQRQLAVLFIDLDEFKPINDTYGHAFGDKVLVEVAHRMQQPLRETDLIARIGGDEFLVLLEGNPDSKSASNIAQRIKDAVTQPMDIEGQLAGLSLSCGISLYPSHGDSVDSLIRIADEAMYQAKQQGRNSIVVADFPILGIETEH